MVRLLIAWAFLSLATLALGQGERREGPREGSGERISISMRYREQGTSAPLMSSFRHFMLSEIENVPMLAEKFKALMEYQQEKSMLQRQRRQFGEPTGQPSDLELRQFHQLLEREDILTSRQQALMREIIADSDSIQAQIQERRQEVQKLINEGIEPGQDPESPFSNFMETRRLQRILRFYDFIEDGLARMRSDPHELDWLRRLTRGVWTPDDMDPQMVEQSRRRLQQVIQEQQDLHRQIQILDERVRELQELLDAVAPSRQPDPRRPGGGGTGGNVGQPKKHPGVQPPRQQRNP